MCQIENYIICLKRDKPRFYDKDVCLLRNTSHEMMILGSNWLSLLALRVKFLLLYSLIIFILISKKVVDSSNREDRSTSVGDIPNKNIPFQQTPTYSPKNIAKFKCSKVNDECHERVPFNADANDDEFIQSYTTVTSTSDDDLTTQGAVITTANTSNANTSALANVTFRREVNKIKIEDETTKVRVKTTTMTSNRETATQEAHLRKGSHYQTPAKSKSKNLVKLENGKPHYY